MHIMLPQSWRVRGCGVQPAVRYSHLRWHLRHLGECLLRLGGLCSRREDTGGIARGSAVLGVGHDLYWTQRALTVGTWERASVVVPTKN